jgi:hypothetical protein
MHTYWACGQARAACILTAYRVRVVLLVQTNQLIVDIGKSDSIFFTTNNRVLR